MIFEYYFFFLNPNINYFLLSNIFDRIFAFHWCRIFFSFTNWNCHNNSQRTKTNTRARANTFIFKTCSYMILAPAEMTAEKDQKKAAQKCFDAVGLDPDSYRIGHTKARYYTILQKKKTLLLPFSPPVFICLSVRLPFSFCVHPWLWHVFLSFVCLAKNGTCDTFTVFCIPNHCIFSVSMSPSINTKSF